MANKERVQLLVDALRSGEFEQGHFTLEQVHADGKVTNCCLGVACHVAMRNGLAIQYIKGNRVHPLFPDDDRVSLFDAAEGLPPELVMDWYEFDPMYRDPRLNYEGETRTASELNDSLKLTFSAIADAFERTFIHDWPDDDLR